jgi:GntR family transcriptional regulator
MIAVPTPAERPRYHQVADELRRRIRAGALPPGAPLPSESSLMQEFTASRGTVRQAVALLRSEGHVITEKGRGTYVRPVLPKRRLGADRYSSAPSTLSTRDGRDTSFTLDQRIEWSAYQLDPTFDEVPADDATAHLFGVEPGTPLLRRHFVFRAHGVPQQVSTSSYVLDTVRDTPVADPTNEPWPGGSIAQLRSLGIRVTGVRELVRSRMPTADEAATLHIPAGVPVVTITRQMFAGDRVVEVANDIVIPGDRVELDYWIDVA